MVADFRNIIIQYKQYFNLQSLITLCIALLLIVVIYYVLINFMLTLLYELIFFGLVTIFIYLLIRYHSTAIKNLVMENVIESIKSNFFPELNYNEFVNENIYKILNSIQLNLS